MYKFNNILVGLDNTEIDQDLIKATSELSKLSGTKKVFFINVIKDFNLPEEIAKQFPELVEKAVEERKTTIQNNIDSHFDNNDCVVAVEILVANGSITKMLLKTAAKEKVDLFVLGQKSEHKSGIQITRIARRATCSLLIIPKGKKIGFDNIFLPSDGSEYAHKAMEKALALCKKAGKGSKITLQNVYQVPAGYHYTGKSFEEFGEIMKANAEKDMAAFVADFNLKDVNIDYLYSLDKNDDMISVMVQEAVNSKSELLIIGAKGRTSTSALFIGSKAERLVQLNNEIPMLVIRPKGKGEGFLDYIMDI